jgi:hypothetical protein
MMNFVSPHVYLALTFFTSPHPPVSTYHCGDISVALA